MVHIIAAVYLTGINLALILLMRRDKSAAQAGRRRIPETDLLSLGVLGGSIGGILGMLLFRHKTRKPAFFLGYPVMLVLQAGIVWILLTRGSA